MPSPIAAKVTVKADSKGAEYKPLWNWFGYDEPNYTYTEHGKKLLGELAALCDVPPYIRAHNLLTSGDGTPALKWGSTNAYTEDADGNPVYDWTIMDRIFDTYVEAGTVPFVQIGFTPEALSDDTGPYQHDWAPEIPTASITAGWSAPPNDLKKWGDLIEAWVRHLAERYGAEKVETWPFEVWNEPDGLYWTGTVEQFCEMYDVAAKAVKKALPKARVGGPHTCGAFANEKAATFLRTFLKHCSDNDSPIDFVGFHAKGNPVVHDEHVRMGIHKQLRDIEANLAIMNEFPKLKGLTAILGESDPEGCAACSARVHPRNAYRNGPLYGVYAVETMIRTYELSARAGIEIEGAVTWAFMFDKQPWFDGFRSLATNGVDKAVLNGFRMLGKLGGKWVDCASSHALGIEDMMLHGVRTEPDLNAVATADDKGVSILVWHYHDDDTDGPEAEIALSISGLPQGAGKLTHFRMDHDHSNAFAVWQAMGKPQDPKGADYEKLEAAGKLAVLEEREVSPDGGSLELSITLPRQAVSLLRIE